MNSRNILMAVFAVIAVLLLNDGPAGTPGTAATKPVVKVVKPACCIPTPNFDSGWRTILADQTLVIMHNLGGTLDNYLVDVTFKTPTGAIGGVAGIDEYRQAYDCGGGKTCFRSENTGIKWSGLSTSSISIYRGKNEAPNYTEYIRVRIWVY